MRALNEIAREIRANWVPSFAARPYLDAMLQLRSIDDNYGFDSARSIVSYFLANATTWRGDVARRIKAELRAL